MKRKPLAHFGVKRSVFSYPYVVYAIVFLLAPLLLILVYSVTLPINPFSVSVNEEYVRDEVVEKLGFTGYVEDSELSEAGTYYLGDDGSVTVNNYRQNRTEIYRIFFDAERGTVSLIEEYDADLVLFDTPPSVKFINRTDGFVFTVQHFVRFFSSPIYITVFLRSLYIAFVSTVLCLLLGFPTAYILSKTKESTRNLLSVMFILPMWMNFLLRTYAWRTLLEKSGVINSILSSLGLPEQNLMYSREAVIICMVYNFLPFMILPIYNTLIKIDTSLLEASHDLGANHYQTLFRVIMPLSLPGVSSGITMTFVPSITAFAISNILGGTESSMIGEVIEREFNYDYWFGSAISVIIMVLLVVSMMIFSKSDKDEVSGGLL